MIEPRAHGGGAIAKLNREQVALVATLIEEDNDAILVELLRRLLKILRLRLKQPRAPTDIPHMPASIFLEARLICERLEQRIGVRVSRATMGRITQTLKLTRKKNPCTPVFEILNASNAYGLSIGTPLVR